MQFLELNSSMLSNKQKIGWILFAVCIITLVGYLVILLGYKQLVKPNFDFGGPDSFLFWLIAIPVLIGVVTTLSLCARVTWRKRLSSQRKCKIIQNISSMILSFRFIWTTCWCVIPTFRWFLVLTILNFQLNKQKFSNKINRSNLALFF